MSTAVDMYEFEETDTSNGQASSVLAGRKPRSRQKKGSRVNVNLSAHLRAADALNNNDNNSSSVVVPPSMPNISTQEIMQLDHIIAQTGWQCIHCLRTMRVKGHSWTEFKRHCEVLHGNKNVPKKRVMFTDFESECVESPDGFFIPKNMLTTVPNYGGPVQRQLEDVRYFEIKKTLPPSDDATPPQTELPSFSSVAPPNVSLALHSCTLHAPPPCNLNGQYVYVPRQLAFPSSYSKQPQPIYPSSSSSSSLTSTPTSTLYAPTAMHYPSSSASASSSSLQNTAAVHAQTTTLSSSSTNPYTTPISAPYSPSNNPYVTAAASSLSIASSASPSTTSSITAASVFTNSKINPAQTFSSSILSPLHLQQQQQQQQHGTYPSQTKQINNISTSTSTAAVTATSMAEALEKSLRKSIKESIKAKSSSSSATATTTIITTTTTTATPLPVIATLTTSSTVKVKDPFSAPLVSKPKFDSGPAPLVVKLTATATEAIKRLAPPLVQTAQPQSIPSHATMSQPRPPSPPSAQSQLQLRSRSKSRFRVHSHPHSRSRSRPRVSTRSRPRVSTRSRSHSRASSHRSHSHVPPHRSRSPPHRSKHSPPPSKPSSRSRSPPRPAAVVVATKTNEQSWMTESAPVQTTKLNTQSDSAPGEICVKVMWEAQMFRIRLSALRFSLFIETLAQRFAPHKRFTVKYPDEDGDMVTVTTTQDLEEAVRVTQKLKFVITPC